MFNFLKKHQRKFLIFITVMTVSSFIFFGTFSAFINPKQEIADREIVLSLSGKPIMKRELYALCQMLASSALDTRLKTQSPNFLNDGVLEKELLENGMELLLAEPYFSYLKPELDVRLKKMKNFRPLSHPQAPYMSAMAIWQRFAPALIQHLELLKKQGEECTLETLGLMIQLYKDQQAFPPEMLKQILFFQQQQQGLPSDPRLAQMDLSLFGFSSLEEWFGLPFVELGAQFIANAAALSQERGYEVKLQEVRTDLFQNIYTGYKRFMHSNGSFTQEDAQHYFQRKMQQMGLDEQMVCDAWRKVMLFRRLFADVGGSVLIDALAYQHFQQYAQHCAKIQLYEIPVSLQLCDFQSMLKFQIYLESIAANPQQLRMQLALPTLISSIEQMEKRNPEIIQKECELEYAEVKKSALASEMSLKETWDWEVRDPNWTILQQQFLELRACLSVHREERFKALDALEGSQRLAVDTFARLKMIEQMPQKIWRALDLAKMQKTKVSLRLYGGSLPFSGVADRSVFLSLLEQAPLSEEGLLLSAENPLYCYSEDKEHFYRIHVLQRDAQKHAMSFSEALEDGTLDILLNRALEEAYPEVRKKNARYFQLDKGEWKPLKEVKDEVGRYVFSDLLKTMEESYKAQMGTLPGNAGQLPLVFYSNYRLFFHMQEAKRHLQSHPNDPEWIATEDGGDHALSRQWRLQKSERVIKRSDSLAIPKEEMFTLQPQQWSSIKLGSGGALAFYQVIEQVSDIELSPDQIKRGQEILSLDARKQLMVELIAQIDRKKAIDLTQTLGEPHAH